MSQHTFFRYSYGNGFEFEIEHVSECIRSGVKESPKMTLAETLQTAQMIEKIRSNWKIVKS